MASGFFLLKVVASTLGPAGFGEYALSRRATGLLYLPLVMGLGIAAPRYIAIARAGAQAGYSAGRFALATLAVGLLPAAALALVLVVVPEASARLLFGSAALAPLVPATSVSLAGIAVHSIVYAVYRERSEMGPANTLQAINLGIVPLAVFGMADSSAAAVLTATGAIWLTTGMLGVMHLLLRARSESPPDVSIGGHAWLLLRFGLPRVPGEFALVGLFAIPTLIAVRAHGVVEAGQLSAAMSLLTIVSGAFAPVGLILLPRVSAQAATGDIDGVRQLVMRILGGGVLLAGAGVVVGEIAIPLFIRWYFGPDFLAATAVFRACLLGAVPFAIYVLLRNVLDALDVKAVNSRNLVVSLAILVVLCLIRRDLLWMSLSLVASLAVLAALSLRDASVRLRAPLPSRAAATVSA